MAQTLRASGRLLARVSSRTLPPSRRSFAAASISRADLIQDLYLKELRAYKPPPQKASDAEGQVQKFTPPAAPKSPEETNLASEMKEYEEQSVEIEGTSQPGETQPEENFFEDLDAIDAEDKETAHH
ncbi:F-type H+-transporting ATPase subunit H [Cladophialophora yegresii CBS 114405]|uniref:F-type H+-transporting ATPase subunit H n=1 Tax=Cladophialophora yegresii CBS 114405 TaxID=1182544 RepID=W9VPF6_9EURO|nr:F-type H+-transporting ATPase subunit H [Cladophialophora yegresii CBS 114405]EXJ57622.1 F-type H+-transporting ATPase subunit H [Cladophialophora yegresii CBS 114405]